MSTLTPTVQTKTPSRWQTTEIIDERFPGRFFYGEDFCPVLPPEWQADYNRGDIEEIQIRDDKDGSLITWYEDGIVKKAYGTSLTFWYTKPTLKSAIDLGKYEKAGYTEFRTDGCVVQSRPDVGGVSFFWGPEVFTVEPTQGEVVRKYMVDYDTDCYDDCGCRNSYRCCGYDSSDAYYRG
jgi:hypothetical protein